MAVRRPRGSTRRRTLLALALAVVLLEAAYLLTANLVLASPWLRGQVNRHPERLQVTWAEARTWWPGRVRVADLSVERHSPAADWRVQVERATLTVSLAALADRTFATRRADLEGVGLLVEPRPRSERRGERTPAGRVVLAASPPPGPPPPDDRRPRRPRWSVHLYGVRATRLNEVRIGDYRLAGRGSVACDLELGGGRLGVFDASLTFTSAELSGHGPPLVRDLELRVRRLTLGPYSPASHRGRAALRFLTAELSLEGRLDDLGGLFPAAFLGGPVPLLDTLRGAAEVTGTVTVRGGRLAPGSAVEVASDDLEAGFLGYRARGRAQASGKVSVLAGSPLRELQVDLREVGFRRSGEASPYLTAPTVTIRAAVPTGSPSPLRDAAVTVELPAGDLPDLSVYNAYLPPVSGIAFESGRGTLSATFRARGGGIGGRLELRGQGLRARVRDRTVTGDFELDTRLAGGEPGQPVFDLAGTRLRLLGLRVLQPDTPAAEEAWSATAELTRGAVRWREPLQAAGDVDLEARDLRPLFALFLEGRKVEWVDRILGIQGLTGHAAFALGRGLALDDVTLHAESLEVRGRLRLAGPDTSGAVYARVHGVGVAVGLAGSRRDWKVIGARKWFERQPRLLPAEPQLPPPAD
jgi:hypothetical protein